MQNPKDWLGEELGMTLRFPCGDGVDGGPLTNEFIGVTLLEEEMLLDVYIQALPNPTDLYLLMMLVPQA